MPPYYTSLLFRHCRRSLRWRAMSVPCRYFVICYAIYLLRADGDAATVLSLAPYHYWLITTPFGFHWFIIGRLFPSDAAGQQTCLFRRRYLLLFIAVTA